MMEMDPRLPDDQKARLFHRHGYLREAADLLPFREAAPLLLELEDIPELVHRMYRWYEKEHPLRAENRGMPWIRLGTHPDDEGDLIWAMSTLHGQDRDEKKWWVSLRLDYLDWDKSRRLTLEWGPEKADAWLRSCCRRLYSVLGTNLVERTSSITRHFLHWSAQQNPFPADNYMGSRSFGATRIAQDIALDIARGKGLHITHPEAQKERREALYRERRWQGLEMLSFMMGERIRA